MSNTTILTIPNETALGQENSSCIFVDSAAEKISKVCASCIIFLGSFFGNIFVIIIVYKHRDLRKTINYFIVNMAVSDLVSSLIVGPINITVLLTGSWHWRVSGILGSIFCKFAYFASAVSVHVSSQSLVWIAIDRFVAVVLPIKCGLISTKTRTAAIVSTWIVAGLFNFRNLIAFGLAVQQNNTYCIEVSNTESVFTSQEFIAAYFWLQAMLFGIAPLSLITILYTAIAIALKRQSKVLADTATNVQQHAFKKRRQAIRMSVVIIVMFYICVIPYTILHLSSYLSTSCATYKLPYFFARLMYYSSSIVNPIICLSFVESYRRGLRNILCPCSRMRNSVMAKREQVTLKEIKNLPKENRQEAFKGTENGGET
ncbi:QRFP-like peptide receptor [Oculina patagonica]